MDTTLEEVFLKVSEEDLSLENSDAGKREDVTDTKNSPATLAGTHIDYSASATSNAVYKIMQIQTKIY